MKRTFFFLLLFSIILSSDAQNSLQLQYKLCIECPQGDQQNINYTYDSLPSNYMAHHIESDYDMRITDGTKYHQGIDYKPRTACTGDAVLSVENGTVVFVKGNGNLKNIVIQNGNRAFVYMHLFRDGVIPTDGMRSGDFILKSMTNGNFVIINLHDTVAYAAQNNLLVTYKRYINSTKIDSIYTTNQVRSGDMIAPIGDSGDIPVHLHVALIENPVNGDRQGAFQGGRHLDRSIDPWSVLAHPNNGFVQRLRTRKASHFSLEKCEHTGPGNDPWDSLKVKYTQGTLNTIEIEVAMQNAVMAPGDSSRYNNTSMDQEEVVLGTHITQPPSAAS